ncbi:MAG: hypothetical protein JW754_05645 [Candidatus Aenigmarchaeota archaeon]|nr:hypothetical protein [Candidatus Aenigmarchaeota archaeon]
MGMKGVSPVIAAVILIGITVAVGVMISSWVTQWVNNEIGGASSCASYSTYSIDSATYKSSTKNLTLKITNNGKIDLHGFEVQILNATSVVLYNSTSSDLSISPTITENNPLKEQRSAIIIVDMNGTEGDYSAIGSTSEEIKVLNMACPQSFARVTGNDITKE